MNAATPTASCWTCDRCGVSFSRIDGASSPLPQSWAAGADGLFCLGCRRERAGEAALDAAPADCSTQAKAKVRRSGLLEFELRRAPDRADNAIAKTCHTSASTVAAARRAVKLPA